MSKHDQALSDEDLMAMFQDDTLKEKAFALIVRGHQERIYWHLRRMVVNHDDANDVLQNAFIKAWKSLENFRSESSLYTWLYRIATNEALSFLELQKKQRSRSVSDSEDAMSRLLKSEKGFDYNKLEWKLQLAIQSLPDKQKVVFNLRYYDEMPYEKMSEILGTSVGGLKATYHHAAKKVEEYLKSH